MTFNLGVIVFRDGQQSILLEMKKNKKKNPFKWNMVEQKSPDLNYYYYYYYYYFQYVAIINTLSLLRICIFIAGS
jgi:hypothetical protein